MSNKNLDKAQKDAPIAPSFNFGKPAGTTAGSSDFSILSGNGITAFELWKKKNPEKKYLDPSQGQGIRSQIRKALASARNAGYYGFKVKVREQWDDGKEHNGKRYVICKPEEVPELKKALSGYEFGELKPVK